MDCFLRLRIVHPPSILPWAQADQPSDRFVLVEEKTQQMYEFESAHTFHQWAQRWWKMLEKKVWKVVADPPRSSYTLMDTWNYIYNVTRLNTRISAVCVSLEWRDMNSHYISINEYRKKTKPLSYDVDLAKQLLSYLPKREAVMTILALLETPRMEQIVFNKIYISRLREQELERPNYCWYFIVFSVVFREEVTALGKLTFPKGMA